MAYREALYKILFISHKLLSFHLISKASLSEEEIMLTVRKVTSFAFAFYNFVGIKLFQWDNDDKLTKRQKYTLILTLIIFVMNFICKFSCFILRKYEDAQEFTKLIAYFGFASNGVVKMLSVWLGRKTLHEVIKDLEKNFPRTSNELHEFKYYEHYAFVKRHMYLLSILHWTISIVFMLFPIVQSTFEYLANLNGDGKFIPRFPYIMVYPFDHRKPAGFAFAYITQLIGGVTIHSYFCGSDSLLLATVHLVNMQFDSLALRIRKFKTQGYKKDLQELKQIIKIHISAHENAERVNDVFNISILLNYLISIAVLVMIGVQVITGTELWDLSKFVGFLVSCISQVYYVCFYGSLLLDYSSKIGEELMNQEWYLADNRYQRMVILVIARSQRPAHLTAYKFFIISMESFSNLMTTAYQFFTLIKARMEEEN
uniref:Odorant receptor n=1 Tax=Glossina brevipalpis TaxID=37001 RepID=A0A1A9WPE0_9MUSC